MPAVLEVENLRKVFRGGRGILARGPETVAVDSISFSVERSTTYGLVGESGSGKSTTARMVCRLLEPDGGRVLIDGADILGVHGRALKRLRRRIQMVFQDPFASLDPRWRVGSLIGEGIRTHDLLPRQGRRARVAELLELCGLRPEHADRYPHEFSGGQRQRIGIARALAVEPEILVLDEPVSALDVSIRAQILTLLKQLQAELGLTYLFIAHDLAIVERFCDRLAVMRAGAIVEQGTPEQVYGAASHPYTQELLDAIPIPDPSLRPDLKPSLGG
jgi:ABC-type oligopeptide transport system ATPase subunit